MGSYRYEHVNYNEEYDMNVRKNKQFMHYMQDTWKQFKYYINIHKGPKVKSRFALRFTCIFTILILVCNIQ
jgi:hypothetical protein